MDCRLSKSRVLFSLKKLNGNVAVGLDARHWQILFHTEFFVIPQYAVVGESKAVAINVTKERVIILVKLRVALRGHASVPHHDIYAVRNVNLHLSSGNRTLVDVQTVVEIVGDARRIRAAHLTLSLASVFKILFFVWVLRHSLKSIKPNKLHIF